MFFYKRVLIKKSVTTSVLDCRHLVKWGRQHALSCNVLYCSAALPCAVLCFVILCSVVLCFAVPS